MKKATFVLLTVCILCACLAACGGTEEGTSVDLQKEIVGVRWETAEVFPEEVNTMLENYLFEEEEIAYANAEDFAFYRVLTFNEDGTATLAYDLEKTREGEYNALDKFMGTLYEHKEDLVDLYGQDMVDDCDTEEYFKDVMAYLIGEMDSAEELLSYFADNVVTYYFGANQYANLAGTYTIDGVKIAMDLSEDERDTLTYDETAGTLTSVEGLVFSKVAG